MDLYDDILHSIRGCTTDAERAAAASEVALEAARHYASRMVGEALDPAFQVSVGRRAASSTRSAARDL